METTAHITLTEQEQAVLETLGHKMGKTQEELIREALEKYFSQLQSANRRDLLQQARGMWKERNDLPDIAELRAELERYATP